MLQTLNTLYVTTPGAFLQLDHDTVKVRIEKETRLQLPLLQLDAIVCFGNITISPALMRRCGEDGRAIVLHDYSGRFKARVVGPTGGNVLLRRAQHLALSDSRQTAEIARSVVAGKLQNSRQVLLRAAREAPGLESGEPLSLAAGRVAMAIQRLRNASTLDQIRGHEGEASRAYFQAFGHMVRVEREAFGFSGRVRRPPIGRVNALISFLYALLLNDCVAAAEGVGLDPQVGYLHALRPGKPALGLDLMEELRAVLADRLALTLINRRQLQADDFVEQQAGAMRLTDEARKRVIGAYQTRKQEEVRHMVLDRAIPLGFVPHVQARLFARHLRGDLHTYLPYLAR